MKSANAIYKIIKALTSAYQWYEIRITQGNNVYGLDTLKSVVVSSSLSSDNGIGIGSANSTECKITVTEQSINWPRMAQFTVRFRLCSGNYTSNWMTVGTFYTDERTEDKYGNLSIRAYDGMLMMEQSWTDKIPEQLLPATFPITAYEWASMIQSAGLAVFADLTQLDDTVDFVGLDTTTTIRDVLKSIAAVHAGNWVMTSDEKLKLIQYTNLDISQATSSQYVDLGLSMKNFDDSPALDPISGVHLETEAGTVMEDGDDTGYVLKAICSVAKTTGVAELCLSRIEGYVYKPFSATTAFLDPIADIGDQVAIDGTMYQLMSAVWDFTKDPVANIEAPYDQEIDHEYTIPSEQAKSYRKTMAAVAEQMSDYVPWSESSTVISQNEAQISLIAESTCVSQEDFDEAIADIQNQIDGNIQSWSGNVVPTLNNAPAVDWTTSAAKAEHVGDMYFINSDAGIPEAGQYYRFEENNGVYSWQLITDSAITEALAQAAAALAAAEGAQDTADAAEAEAQLKGRIFVVQPAPPYNVGDLWFDSDHSEILTCMTAKTSGGFASGDWVKRNKYTDDSAFAAFQIAYNDTISAIQEQIDQKAETYYQDEDPINEWDATIAGIAIAGISVVGFDGEIGMSHKGDLWYRTTDNTTWFWDGTQWVLQEVPDEVFDKIDGKAQVFINTPYTPYNVGDLWFNSASSEIMTCVVARATGDFVSSDWEKRNKYTDDSSFTTFVNATYNPTIAAIQANLDGKVDTYFYAYAPTLQNIPASQWTTNDDKDAHIDDLFYDTVSGYTYRFKKDGSTYSWERIKDEDINAAMEAASTAQDTADGKRRVFVVQPTNADEYDVGDLWVNATYGSTYSNDLLRCKTAKVAGVSFNISHWEKASKYTDDTAANAVGQSLTQFISEFSVEPSQIRAEVEKRVIQDQQSTKNTFGWLMNDTSHTWYANNQEVMKVQQSGVSVVGSITATSGYIGNGASGFEIGNTYIRNGMQSLYDTTHNGVYVGTDGIALGKGAFKATYTGAVTASDLTINGGTISIGGTAQNPTFYVDANGNLYAQSGTFSGNVYAANIQYGGAAGTFNGAGITTQTITGGYNGQIDTYTIDDYNVAQYTSGGVTYGSLTTSSFSSGVQTSLYQADRFGLATNPSSGEYPSYFCAQSIRALRGVTGSELYVDYGDETTLSVSNHYHRITVNQDGTVTFGVPYNSNTPPSFNVADTHAYRDAVSAVTVTSLDLEYEYDDEMHIYRLMGYAKNQAGTVVYQSTAGQWNTDRSAYVDGKADGADEVTITSITRTYPDGETSYPYYDSPTLGKIIEFKAQAAMSNGHGDSSILTVPADAAYNAGYEDGSQGGSGSVTVTSLGFDPNDPVSYSATVNNYYVPIKTVLSNNVTRTTTLTVPATDAYNAGSTAGAADVRVTTLGVESYQAITYSATTRYYQVPLIAVLSNEVTRTTTVAIPGQLAYEDGQASVTASATGLTTNSSTYGTYDQSLSFGSSSLYTVSGTQYGRIQVTLSNGVTRVVRVGMPAGSAAVDSITVARISGDMNDWEFEGNNVFVGVNLAAKNGSTTVYSTTGRVNVNDVVNFWADEAYDHAGVLDTTSSNYTSYDTGYSWGTKLFNPTLSSGGSSVYGRVGIYNGSNSILATLRFAMSMSIYSASTSSDYSDYYQSGGRWYLKIHVRNSSTEIYQGAVDVQQAVDYGAASGGGTSYQLYCISRTENSAGLVTCDFSISSYNGLPWRANNYYTFKYG